jgi:hypothetical protein
MTLPLAVRLFLDEPKAATDAVGNLAHMVCLKGATSFLSAAESAAMYHKANTVAVRRALLANAAATPVYAYIARIGLRVTFQDDGSIEDDPELQDILMSLTAQRAIEYNNSSIINRKRPEQLLQLPFAVATGDLQVSDICPTEYIKTLELPENMSALLDAAVRRACMQVHSMSVPPVPNQ